MTNFPEGNFLKYPFTFSSTVCRESHFRMPLYLYWCNKLHENPRFHRKQWEFVYICHVLYERGMLTEGKTAIGFGVGKEPLAALFASNGISVTATDLDFDQAQNLGWVSTSQHASSLDGLNERQICNPSIFRRNTRFMTVDMTDLPKDIGKYDFIWSSCAFEHLGSIRAGLDFVKSSSELLKEGGIAVHTTEFNLSSNFETLDNNPSFVLFRKRDLETLGEELQALGFEMERPDFHIGDDRLERYVDLPPYKEEPHIRLMLAEKFVSTSIGLVIKKRLNT